ncbi:hypothetical protein C8R45DRAFT_359872 [Mycena sanguinolenta]|nr:hypothetical protein C8R45DRAFT_359872 [Mycena sanguinolenta]
MLTLARPPQPLAVPRFTLHSWLHYHHPPSSLPSAPPPAVPQKRYRSPNLHSVCGPSSFSLTHRLFPARHLASLSTSTHHLDSPLVGPQPKLPDLFNNDVDINPTRTTVASRTMHSPPESIASSSILLVLLVEESIVELRKDMEGREDGRMGERRVWRMGRRSRAAGYGCFISLVSRFCLRSPLHSRRLILLPQGSSRRPRMRWLCGASTSTVRARGSPAHVR